VSNPDFLHALTNGLRATQKRLEPKFFYDETGSALFDEITRLDAYYPTRTEIGILQGAASEISAVIGPGAVVLEPGAGSAAKASLLLDALENPAAFAPGDISIYHLIEASAGLQASYPNLPIRPFALDFDHAFDPPAEIAALGPVTVFFPGSTIGNFEPPRAISLLERFAGVTNAHYLLIGVDLKKDHDRLVQAYDDPEGVTARFNLNLLVRANRELGADFDLSAFAHQAVYNADDGRIEMHLKALSDQTVTVGTEQFAFLAGETIHTENSYKYTVAEFQALAAKAGWRAHKVWTDDAALFSVQLFHKAK
jgi:dimethylhistidine N-methyltransferase